MEINKNEYKKNKIDPRVILGIGLVIIGALILFDNMYLFDINIQQ